MDRPTFNLDQLALVVQATRRGEALVVDHYRIPMLPSKHYPYEVATLVDMEPAERAPAALAHLVVYERPRPAGVEALYRVCLQDDAILSRARDGTNLGALLVYVLTHELVHVVRFQRAEQSFTAPRRARKREEDEVHHITMQLLEQARVPQVERLHELCGNPVRPALRVEGGSPARVRGGALVPHQR